MGYFGKALMTPASYLPSQVTEVFAQGRAFAVAKLPRAGNYIHASLLLCKELSHFVNLKMYYVANLADSTLFYKHQASRGQPFKT